MASDTRAYYDAMARYYRYFFENWEESVPRHAARLDAVIKGFPGVKKSVLDVSCGIGTQALGLAALGYEVCASDISEGALSEARGEAAARKLDIEFRHGDMRDVPSIWKGRLFDVVLSADNSVPHLLSDADILAAFGGFRALLNQGGCCLVSVRDYAALNPDNRKTMLNPRTVHEVPGGRVVMFDLWRFDGDFYDMDTYVVSDRGGREAETMVCRARYYRVSVERLAALLREAGFREVSVLRDAFYQPVLAAVV